MKITEYIDRVRLQEKSEAERAKLLCFYYSKENGEKQFTLSRISSIMVDSGFNAQNSSRLKDRLIKGKDKAFLLIKGAKNTLEFISTA